MGYFFWVLVVVGFGGILGAMAAAAAGGTRMICWPMAQQQVHVSGGGGGSGSGVASCSGGQGVVRRYADRLQVSRVLPVAVAAPSQFLVTRSSGMRGNLVLCSGKFEVRAVRGSGTRAVSQVVEATTAGLRETVEDTAVADGHSRSFEGIQTEQGDCPGSFEHSFVVKVQQNDACWFCSLFTFWGFLGFSSVSFI